MIIKLIEKYRYVIESWRMIRFDQDGPNLSLKAEFVFKDESSFFVRQVVLSEFTFKYAYHWQDRNGRLICRWDNAAHWPEIPTYPHHKHIMANDQMVVEASKGGDLEDVFEEIAERLKK